MCCVLWGGRCDPREVLGGLALAAVGPACAEVLEWALQGRGGHCQEVQGRV